MSSVNQFEDAMIVGQRMRREESDYMEQMATVSPLARIEGKLDLVLKRIEMIEYKLKLMAGA